MMFSVGNRMRDLGKTSLYIQTQRYAAILPEQFQIEFNDAIKELENV